MKTKRGLILFLLVVSVSGTAFAQKIKVRANPNIDFSKYTTYAIDRSPPTANPLINEQIYQAVDDAMAAKGLKKVQSNPQITIAMLTANHTDLHMSYPDWGSAGGTAPDTGIAAITQSWTVTEGTLMVDIADASSKSSVWRGTASGAIKRPSGSQSKDAKSAEKGIKNAVDKLFKQYPRPTGS